MNITTQKLGRIASIAALFSFVLYTICFVSILFINKPFSWTNLEHFVSYELSSNTYFKYIGMGCMILYACTFLVMVLCLRENTKDDKKIFGTVSVAFAICFCLCICITYFVQATSTRLQLLSGNIDGLLQITQSYNISAINGVNMLGWTVFYGLSSLAMYASFDRSNFTKAIKVAFVSNSALMLVGLVGYILNHFLILALTMNLGLGATGIAMIICCIRHFKKLKA